MFTQYQQYHQPQQAVSGNHWNGSAWTVSSPAANPSFSSAVAPSTYSTSYYSSGQQQQQPVASAAAPPSSTPSNNNVIPPDPVATFTRYYHGWQKVVQEHEAYASKLPHGPAREEAERHVGWARYYGDESSRAAHFFYQNPGATSVPFDLPPAPNSEEQVKPTTSVTVTPDPGSAPSGNSFNSNRNQQQQDDEDSPGLKRYVQSCMKQCNSDEQRKEMQAEVEKVIALAITDGTFHTKNWAAEPLLRLASFATSQHQPMMGGGNRNGFHQQPNQMNRNMQRQNRPPPPNAPPGGGYYGPSGGGRGGGGRREYDQKLPGNDSYYGHQAGNANTSPKGQNLASNDSYYGPSNASFNKPNLSPQQNKKRKSVQSDENFIPFQSQQNNNSKKRGKATHTSGFEKSSSALAKRADRFKGPGGIVDASSAVKSLNGADRYMGKAVLGGSQKVLDEEDFEKMTVKGTCQILEKEYLRLTAPPRAELVRPQPILERHLENLKAERAMKEQRHDYLWFCSQFKAVRQDCTVQRIQDAFAVDVYETHARIALEEGDLNEYNQCQTQLKELYEKNSKNSDAMKNHEEFLAYRMLYYVFLSTNDSYDGGSSDLFKIMLSLTSDQMKHHPAIAHACKVREAVALGDYLSFFRLHEASPNLGHYLTDRIVPTMRFRALQRVAKAYRPSVELKFCLQQVGFVDSPSSLVEGKDWLTRCGCVLEGEEFMTKDSDIHEPEADTKNSLI